MKEEERATSLFATESRRLEGGCRFFLGREGEAYSHVASLSRWTVDRAFPGGWSLVPFFFAKCGSKSLSPSY